jgi:hypothetical protein
MFVFFENMLASIKTAAMLSIKNVVDKDTYELLWVYSSYGTGEACLLPVDKQQLYKSQVPRSRLSEDARPWCKVLLSIPLFLHSSGAQQC